jgi:hypothetical protein
MSETWPWFKEYTTLVLEFRQAYEDRTCSVIEARNPVQINKTEPHNTVILLDNGI